MAARIVGDAERMEAGMFRERSGQFQDLAAVEIGNEAAGGCQFGNGHKGLRVLEQNGGGDAWSTRWWRRIGPRQLPVCDLIRLTNYMPACFVPSVKAE